MTTKERVERLRRERSFTHRTKMCISEVDYVLTKYYGKSWQTVKDVMLAITLAILCTISFEN